MNVAKEKHLSLPEDLHTRIKNLAEKEKRSMRSLVEIWVEEAEKKAIQCANKQ